ncbi:alpha/beta hydrolase [Falsirhodobacter halotolerans]|uniref:alpha/beta hydrolase n=1 Tax=Falsirhodobacter halotolerans TaxID=1146892 RepID=UPI001FD391D4|nr:alpha/beta hydrolase [Falsirhodobacter halotolerans]MCJ8138922.1 alpha/beta hydrolase [Falsirhodobacter halotolerans]
MTDFLTTPEGRRIAYDLTVGAGPAVVFLGGFRSDMEGTKALDLRDWAAAQGRTFLRFDYSGHGLSGGRFEDGCIGDWYEDARAALSLVAGPVVLVGSSMGGWISLLLAREMPERVAAFVGIAAAPDFTEDLMWDAFDEDQRAQVMAGVYPMPSPYGEPTPITRRLIEDGRERLVLRSPLAFGFPVRLLQGTADADVPVSVAMRLIQHIDGPDKQMMVIGGADHRFSTPECLREIRRVVAEVA